LPFCTEPKELDRVYVLGHGQTRDVVIERLTESAALLALVRNSFMLDVDREQSLAAQFEQLAELTSRIGFWRLDYPRRFDQLACVRTAIVDHVAAGRQADAPDPVLASG
jgi:hypothetical protein